MKNNNIFTFLRGLISVGLFNVVLPSIVSGGRIINVAGQPAATMQKFEAFINAIYDPQHNATQSANETSLPPNPDQEQCMGSTYFAFTMVIIACAVVVNLLTRTPKTFSQFNELLTIIKILIDRFTTYFHLCSDESEINVSDHDIETPVSISETTEDIINVPEISAEGPVNTDSLQMTPIAKEIIHPANLIDNQTDSYGYFNYRGLSWPASILWTLGKPVIILSGVFGSISSYFFSKSLCKLVLNCVIHNDLSFINPTVKTIMIELTALGLGVLFLPNFAVYNIPKSDQNLRNAIKALFDPCNTFRMKKVNWSLLWTIIAVAPSTLCNGPMAYFSTYNAFLNTNIGLPLPLINALAITSSFTNTFQRLFTDPVAIYDLFSQQKSNEPWSYKHIGILPYKGTVYLAGIPDAIGTGISNCTSIIFTINKVMGPLVDINNPYIIIAAIGTGASSGIAYYAFNVNTGVLDAVKIVFNYPSNSKVNAVEETLPLVDDKKPNYGSLSASPHTMYGNNSRQPLDTRQHELPLGLTA